MSAVEDDVGVVARPVARPQLQEGFDLGLQSLQRHAAGGVVAAERLDEVVREEALHAVQHPRGAPVELLHLVRRQQHGLAVRAAGRGERLGEATGFISSWDWRIKETSRA